MDEDTVLKTAGCKSFGGSIPSPSANDLNVRLINRTPTPVGDIGSNPIHSQFVLLAQSGESNSLITRRS